MIIRSATTADLPHLIVLFQQEISYQRQLNPFFDLPAQFDWRQFVEAKLNKPNEHLLVAERAGLLLGYIEMRTRLPKQSRPAKKSIMSRLVRREAPPALVLPPAVGWIEDCYVQDQFRRQGIGSTLVQEGVRLLRAQGVTRVELTVSAANDDGRQFWEGQGFFASRLLMSKETEPNNEAGK